MILRGCVFSNVLQMETNITIVAPNNFNTVQAYKVVYLFHGLCGNSGDWANYTMLPVYANDYQSIFIMPEVARSFYSDMTYGLKYFSYVTEELPTICKRVFNISSEREDTAVIGCSMGGYGALKSALTKPNQYGYCCTFSSPCLFLKDFLDLPRTKVETAALKEVLGEQLFSDFQAIFGEDLMYSPKEDVLDLAKKVSTEKVKPKIYSACGMEDPYHKENVRFKNEMSSLNINFTFEEWSGNHDWYFFNNALKKGMEFCFKN